MTGNSPRTLLVTGGQGQLGRHVAAAATGSFDRVAAPGSAELDITEPEAVDRAVATFVQTAGLVVLNTAAYTAVDRAESDPERAHAVNADGPAHLAAACARHGAHLIQVSTDYVFAGDHAQPYRIGDPPGPRTVYGRSKLAGEKAVLESGARVHVVRTAWLYGRCGRNFVTTMARLERERDTVAVVDDQYGCPTSSVDLAGGLVALARAAEGVTPGVLHFVNTGSTSWYGLARAVFTELGADPERVRPCSTDQFPRPAPRPANSVLDISAWVAAGLPAPRHWRHALGEAIRVGVTCENQSP